MINSNQLEVYLTNFWSTESKSGIFKCPLVHQLQQGPKFTTTVSHIDQHSANLCEISSAYVYWLLQYLHCKSQPLTHCHLIHYREYPPLLLSYLCSLCRSIYTEGCKANALALATCFAEHLMSSFKLTACGAGRARHLTGMYSPFFALQTFASIGATLGQLIAYCDVVCTDDMR